MVSYQPISVSRSVNGASLPHTLDHAVRIAAKSGNGINPFLIWAVSANHAIS